MCHHQCHFPLDLTVPVKQVLLNVRTCRSLWEGQYLRESYSRNNVMNSCDIGKGGGQMPTVPCQSALNQADTMAFISYHTTKLFILNGLKPHGNFAACSNLFIFCTAHYICVGLIYQNGIVDYPLPPPPSVLKEIYGAGNDARINKLCSLCPIHVEFSCGTQ